MTQRAPRLLDRPYLNWLKERNCVSCTRPGPGDPAHIREGSFAHGKPMTGMGRKPDDRWAVPLCRSCHDSQHARGDELAWWSERGLDPFKLANHYYAMFGGNGGKPRKQREIKPRLPREKRAKIMSRAKWQ